MWEKDHIMDVWVPLPVPYNPSVETLTPPPSCTGEGARKEEIRVKQGHEFGVLL